MITKDREKHFPDIRFKWSLCHLFKNKWVIQSRSFILFFFFEQDWMLLDPPLLERNNPRQLFPSRPKIYKMQDNVSCWFCYLKYFSMSDKIASYRNSYHCFWHKTFCFEHLVFKKKTKFWYLINVISVRIQPLYTERKL